MVIIMGTSNCHMLLGDSEKEVWRNVRVVEDGIIPVFLGEALGILRGGSLRLV